MKKVFYRILLPFFLLGLTSCAGERPSVSEESKKTDLGYEQISAEEAKSIMDSESEYVIVDARTEEEFAESLAFIQKCAFAEMHIFPYSRRPGTPADKMPGQHNNATKEQRSREAIAVAEEMSTRYRENLLGKTLEVLFEEQDGIYFTGHAPNYVKVYCEGENLHNQIRTVTVTDVYKDGVKGK